MEAQKKMKMKKKATLMCKRRLGTNFKCKNISGENKLQLCDKHFQLQKEFLAKNPSVVSEEKLQIFGIQNNLILTNKKEKKEEGQRCCRSDGIAWRCKNVRMCFEKFCRKHYLYHLECNRKNKENQKKKYCSKKQMKKTVVAEGDQSLEVYKTGGQLDPSGTYNTIISNIGKKRVIEDDPIDTKIQLATTAYSTFIPNIKTKGKRTQRSRELKSKTIVREAVVQSESLEYYKSKCCELSVELEEKKAEFTKLQGVIVDLETRRKNATEDERLPEDDATDYWKRMFFNLESRVLKIECVESRVSNLESLVLRNGQGDSENIEPEATQSCEKQRDENNMRKSNTETSSEGRKDIHVCELKTKKKVMNLLDVGIVRHYGSESEFPKYSAVNTSSGNLHLSSGGENVEEGMGWDYSEQRPSQDQLETNKKSFVNLVSDDGGEFGESLATSYLNPFDVLFQDGELLEQSLMRGSCSNIDEESSDSMHGVVSGGWESEDEEIEAEKLKPIDEVSKFKPMNTQENTDNLMQVTGAFKVDCEGRDTEVKNISSGIAGRSDKEVAKLSWDGVTNNEKLGRGMTTPIPTKKKISPDFIKWLLP